MIRIPMSPSENIDRLYKDMKNIRRLLLLGLDLHPTINKLQSLLGTQHSNSYILFLVQLSRPHNHSP